MLSCDWSGQARSGGKLLNDGSQNAFDLFGDGIDTLLVTGNSENSRTSHWQCRSLVHGWERSLFLFSDGSLEFDGAGRWSTFNNDQIEVSLNSGVQFWTNIEIAENSEVRYNHFSALVDGEAIDCDWVGAPRASAYIE